MPLTDFKDLASGVWDNIKCTFAEDIRYQPKTGGDFPVRAVFGDKFEQIDPDTERVIASNQFMIGIQLKDLPQAPRQGDKVIIRDVAYLVVTSQEDGVVGAEILLHKEC